MDPGQLGVRMDHAQKIVVMVLNHACVHVQTLHHNIKEKDAKAQIKTQERVSKNLAQVKSSFGSQCIYSRLLAARCYKFDKNATCIEHSSDFKIKYGT